jgi:hypothetical protein
LIRRCSGRTPALEWVEEVLQRKPLAGEQAIDEIFGCVIRYDPRLAAWRTPPPGAIAESGPNGVVVQTLWPRGKSDWTPHEEKRATLAHDTVGIDPLLPAVL